MGQALSLVKEIDDLDKIWERLKSSFGNASTLLSAKINKIDVSTPLWKVKGDVIYGLYNDKFKKI